MRQTQNSTRLDWRTPVDFFTAISLASGGFVLDAAADASNHLCKRWYGPGGEAEDALLVPDWPTEGKIWCNPPYENGDRWRQWLRKFQAEARKGASIVTLLPAATGTKWWAEEIVQCGADILFLTGRLAFQLPRSVRRKKSAPNHDSALVTFGPDVQGLVGWINSKPNERRVERLKRGMDAVEARELPGLPVSEPLDGVHEPSPVE